MSSISLNISNRPRNFKKIFSLERWGMSLLSVQSLTLLWDIYTHVCIYIILGAFVYVCMCVCVYIYINKILGGFPGSSAGSSAGSSVCNARDPDLVPGSGRYAVEGIGYPFQYSWASLVAQMINHPLAMRETWV